MIPIAYNLRSLAVRRTTTLASVLGIGLVVFVLAGALMLSAGIKQTLSRSGHSDIALVLRKGSDAEMASSIESPTMALILSAPGVKKDESGNPLGIGEVLIVATLDKVGVDGVSNVQIRGVPEGVTRFRKSVQIVDGRAARPGTDEVIIGQRLRGRFKGLDLGQSFELRKNRPAQVVGVFSDEGSSHESEIWGDIDTVRQAYGRSGLYSSVRVQLSSPSQFDAFEAVIEGDKALGLDALREDRYYEKQSEGTSIFVTGLGVVVAIIFSIGAMIGAMITMYASIASRSREIGTLRALGFSRRSILASFLLEALALALSGGLLGIALSLGLGTVRFSMMNFASWSEIVFSFSPTPGILLTALLFAGMMGLFGGLFPAVRATRISPLSAMRD
ncbi:MAG TPA: ABC transporter permease [Pseudomonadota bacterium]|nr:ABC transporter permease [Pseudomonadota bacterium]